MKRGSWFRCLYSSICDVQVVLYLLRELFGYESRQKLDKNPDRSWIRMQTEVVPFFLHTLFCVCYD